MFLQSGLTSTLKAKHKMRKTSSKTLLSSGRQSTTKLKQSLLSIPGWNKAVRKRWTKSSLSSYGNTFDSVSLVNSLLKSSIRSPQSSKRSERTLERIKKSFHTSPSSTTLNSTVRSSLSSGNKMHLKPDSTKCPWHSLTSGSLLSSVKATTFSLMSHIDLFLTLMIKLKRK